MSLLQVTASPHASRELMQPSLLPTTDNEVDDNSPLNDDDDDEEYTVVESSRGDYNILSTESGTQRPRRRKRNDIINPNTKPRWTRDQINFLLYHYGTMRLGSNPETERPSIIRNAYKKLAALLEEQFPEAFFNYRKVQRKIYELLRNWKAFIPIHQADGVSYDSNSGQVITTSDNWRKFDREYGAAASNIRNNGLYRKDLYERAFTGTEALSSTALEATDDAGLERLRTLETRLSLGYSGTSSSSASASRRTRRPRRASMAGSATRDTIDEATLAILTRGQRVDGADDTQQALRDVQERFLMNDNLEEVEFFIDWILEEGINAVHYNSLNDRLKERLFRRKTDEIGFVET